jgi:hypothetical protein
MADVAVTPAAPLMTGAAWAWTAVDSSAAYFAVNSGNTALLINNAGGGNVNVTIKRYATFDGDAVADRIVAVLAGTKKVIGMFPTAVYNIKTGANAGKISFAFSGEVGVTFTLLAT